MEWFNPDTLGVVVSWLDKAAHIVGWVGVAGGVGLATMNEGRTKAMGKALGAFLKAMLGQKQETKVSKYASTAREFSEGVVEGLE